MTNTNQEGTMQATQTLAEFIAAQGITLDAEWAERNPHMADDEWARDASHYRVTLTKAGESMELYYSMGAAHTSEPDVEMVLDNLASDAASIENEPDWLEWAKEMGYETIDDAEKARESHKVITKQAGELRDLLGAENYETLLWNIERS